MLSRLIGRGYRAEVVRTCIRGASSHSPRQNPLPSLRSCVAPSPRPPAAVHPHLNLHPSLARPTRRSTFPIIPREEVVLGERLGSGASGDVFAAVYRGQDVAVKVRARMRWKSPGSPENAVAGRQADRQCCVAAAVEVGAGGQLFGLRTYANLWVWLLFRGWREALRCRIWV